MSIISMQVLREVIAEAERAHAKHGAHSMLSAARTDLERLAILAEEFGEVAHELTYDQPGDGLRRELEQVAAMALTWLQHLENAGD